MNLNFLFQLAEKRHCQNFTVMFQSRSLQGWWK